LYDGQFVAFPERSSPSYDPKRDWGSPAIFHRSVNPIETRHDVTAINCARRRVDRRHGSRQIERRADRYYGAHSWINMFERSAERKVATQ
jgi:hypothetical protein